MYSRYAIGAESDLEFALPDLDRFLRKAGWQSGGSAEKSSIRSRALVGGGGRSRTYDSTDMSRVL